MMNEQFQSPFFRLPPELRNAIYSLFILSGSPSQHVSGFWEWGGPRGPNRRLVAARRFPCHGPIEDASFLASVVDPNLHHGPEDIGFEPGSYHSRRRGGHLCCVWDREVYDTTRSRTSRMTAMRGNMRPSKALPSPAALLRSCKRAREEATPFLYSSMRFQSLEDMVTLLDRMGQSGIARMQEVACVWTTQDMAEGYMPPPQNKPQGERWRLLCKTLSRMSQRHSLTLTFDLWYPPGQHLPLATVTEVEADMGENMGPFPAAAIQALKPFGNIGKFEIVVYILDILNREEDKGQAVEKANQDRPFTLRRKIEPPWFQEVLARRAD